MKLLMLLKFSFLLLVVISTIAFGETYNFEQLSEVLFCGGAGEIEIQGNYAFLNRSSRITIVDISNPANPAVVKNMYFPGKQRISIDNNILAMGNRNEGIRLYDVSEPCSLVVLSTIECEQSGVLYLKDDYFFMMMDGSFSIYDVSEPEDPSPVYSDEDLTIYHMDKFGDLISLSSRTSCRIMDVSDPSNPEILSTLHNQGWEGEFHCARLAENRLYTGGFDGVRIYDIEDPSRPFLIGQHYFGLYTRNLLVIDNIAYLAHGSYGLEVVDISDPDDTESLGWIETLNFAQDLAAIENYIIIQDGITGLIVCDVSDPENVREAGRPQPIGYACSVVFHGYYAYVHNSQNKLYTFNVSDPSQPEIVSDLDIDHEAQFMWEYRDVLYVIDTWASDWNVAATTLISYDLNNPANPEEVDRLAIGRWTIDACLEDDNLYLIADANECPPRLTDQLIIIDLSEPLEPDAISTTRPEVFCDQFTVAESAVIVAGRDSTTNVPAYYVYDISNPEEHILSSIYEFDTTGINRDYFWGDMAMHGEYLYVTSPDSTIGIFQLEVNELFYRGIMELDYYPGELIVERDFLYTRGGSIFISPEEGFGISKSIHVYDLANPRNPVERGQYDNQISIVDISSDGYLLASTDGFSFKMFDISEALAVKTTSYSILPSDFYCSQAYPNPCNPRSIIRLGLPFEAEIDVSVYNVIGQKITQLGTGRYSAGYHDIVFNASELSSGIYFIHASVPGKMDEVRKVVLMK